MERTVGRSGGDGVVVKLRYMSLHVVRCFFLRPPARAKLKAR